MNRNALLALLPALLLALAPSPTTAADPPVLWPDDERTFYLDGPAWLLPEEEREALLEMAPAERSAFVDRFLSAEDLPAVSGAQLAEAVERRRRLMRSALLTPSDVRARLLFLHGTPEERLVVDCGETFRPLEVWSYPDLRGGREEGALQPLVLFEPGAGSAWRIWTPYDSKNALYIEQMEYFLEQWHENNGKLFYAERFDLQTCDHTRRIDRATGVRGLYGFETDRPTAERLTAYLEPPADVGDWVQRVLAAPAPPAPPPLPAEISDVRFVERRGQRLVTRFELHVTDPDVLATAPNDAGDGEEHRVVVEGLIEEGAAVLDRFRVRFVFPAEAVDREAGLVLVWEEALRPQQLYALRFQVRDEVGKAASYRSEGFRVPEHPDPPDTETPVPEDVIVAMSEDLARQQIRGADSLVLVPPVEDVVLGLWRAEAIVTGQRIEKVAFSVDGELQITDGKAPYSVELRLAEYPTEQVIRAEGLDGDGEVVDRDQVVINQPRGAFAVRIVDPPAGVALSGRVEVTTQVVVPEGRRVESVIYEVGGEEVARIENPPWKATVEVPAGGGLTYLSVTAELDDGRSAEDVRLLNAPDFVERLDVDLVELYAAVTDRKGRPVRGLTAEDFEVYVEGELQEIERFELVENLPLTVGITIDSSGSMANALAEAQKAARGFLGNIVDVRDHAFAVGFADTPVLLMPPTKDVDAVADSIGRLRSVGWTALHDAVVTSLYYFRGFPGQRVMVLLSDGDDTRSAYEFRDVLEYARRSNVAIYTVGLNVGRIGFGGAKSKLDKLAEETGGRSFFISKAEELSAVYQEIEEELRSRYLLAVAPGSGGDGEGGYREVEVKVGRRGVDVRTARGIYP